MRTTHRRLRATATLAAATVCASVPLTLTAHAATAPTVTTAPTAPTVTLSVAGNAPGTTPTVSGVVQVTATVTAAPGSPVQSLSYGFPSVDSTAQQVSFQPGQCDTTCTYSWTLDTTALKPLLSNATQTPAVPDGAQTVRAVAHSADGMGNVVARFTVDNHRPSVGTLVTGPLDTSAQRLRLTVTPTVSPTAPAGTTIADVELQAPGAPRWPVSHFVRNDDGSWTASFAPGSLPGGWYPELAVVAVDSNGTVSRTVTTGPVTIDAGFTVTAPTADVTGPDWHGLELGVTYPGVTGCNRLFSPTDVRLLVDGHLWQDSQVTSPPNGLGSVCEIAAAPAGTPAKPLPFGSHTLSWVVTDSAGIQETAVQSVTVALPLTASWPHGTRTLVAGSTLHATASGITAPDGFSKLRSWTVTDRTGRVVAHGGSTTRPSATVVTARNRATSGTLTLHLTSDSGLTSSYAFGYRTTTRR